LSIQPSPARTTETALRIAFRYERELASKCIGAVVVTFGLQDLQAFVVECAAGERFEFLGALNGRDIRY
jgi:hypothetical protein